VRYPSERQSEVPQSAPAAEVPAEIRELREADRDRAMLSPQRTYADALKDDVRDTEEARAFRAEAREQFADLGLSSSEARQVVEVFDSALRDGIPDEATRARWQSQALDAVFREHGPKEAPRRIAAARALVARDVRVQRILDATGLGSHPAVVSLLISKAHSERMRGRLK
jgi:hypothetical protein